MEGGKQFYNMFFDDAVLKFVEHELFKSKIRSIIIEGKFLRDLQQHGLFHNTWQKHLLWQEFLNASLSMIPR